MAIPPSMTKHSENNNKSNKSNYNGTEDPNYFEAQTSKTKTGNEVSIPDSWRNNSYVPSSNQIDYLRKQQEQTQDQPKEVKKGEEDASIHEETPTFVSESLANKNLGTYQKSVDDVKSGQGSTVSNLAKAPSNLSQKASETMAEIKQPIANLTNFNPVQNYVSEIETVAKNTADNLSSGNEQVQHQQQIATTANNAPLNEDTFMRDPFEPVTYNPTKRPEEIDQYTPEEQIKKAPDEQIKADASFDKIEEPEKVSLPESFKNAYNQSAAKGAVDAVTDFTSNAVGATKGALDTASKELDPEKILYEPVPESAMSQEQKDANAIYEQIFKEQDPDFDPSNFKNDPLFDPENIAALWAEAEKIGTERFENRDKSDKSQLSQVQRMRPDGSYAPYNTETIKQDYILGAFVELFDRQHETERYDDGSTDLGNISSGLMTWDQYLNYAKHGIPGLSVEEIMEYPKDHIFNKIEEMDEHGFIPYVPNNYVNYKLAADRVVLGGSDVYRDVVNARENITDWYVDLGDGKSRNGGDLVDGYMRYMNTIQNDPDYDPATLDDDEADHTGQSLYFPAYSLIKSKDGSEDLVAPGGVFNVYSVDDGRVLVDFANDQSYVFDSFDDFEERFYKYEANNPNNVTSWIRADDPNLIKSLNTDMQLYFGRVYGYDYIDEETGDLIPFPVLYELENEFNGTDEDISYKYDFGFGGIAKPSTMLTKITRWGEDPGKSFSEDALPTLLDVGAGSVPYMIPYWKWYTAAGDALYGYNNIETGYSYNGALKKHKQDDGTLIDEESAKLFVDNGILTQKEIDEYNTWTPEERVSYIVGNLSSPMLESLSEVISNKVLNRPQKFFASKTTNALANFIISLGFKSLSEFIEETVATYPEEFKKHGPQYAFSPELDLPEDFESPLKLRQKDAPWQDRFNNLYTEDTLESGLLGAYLALAMHLPAGVNNYMLQRRVDNIKAAMAGDEEAIREIEEELGEASDIPSLQYAMNYQG